MTRHELREALAALEHEQWAAWAANIAETESITPARLERWQRLIAAPYAELTEAEKDLDREWADKALALIDEGAHLFLPPLSVTVGPPRHQGTGYPDTPMSGYKFVTDC